MKAFRTIRPAASAMALLAGLGGAQAALAQVTAQEVWDDWKAGLMMEEGVTIGSESYADGVLTVTDIGIDIADEQGGTITGSLAEMVFTEYDDGSVGITMSEELPLTIDVPANGETPASTLELVVLQQGAEIVASGTAGALTYDLAADLYGIELTEIAEDGATVNGQGSVTANAVTGSVSSVSDDETRVVEYDMAGDSIDILIEGTDSETATQILVSGTIEGTTSAGSAVVPFAAMAINPDSAFADGLAVEGSYGYSAATYILEMTDETGPTTASISTGAGEVTLVASNDVIGYDAGTAGIAIDVTAATLPFPISATVAEYGASILIPTSASDAPAEFGFGVNLTDLAINDEVWAAFDPTGTLPRAPFTAILDMTGTATMLFDLLDPAQAEAIAASAAPAELNSLSLNAFELSLLGASVVGNGAFTFDNTDMTTMPGMPRPEGSAQFQMTGINALLDMLSGMGLVPDDQVMGARMFLGLFATPTGEDQLSTVVEATPDGQLLINGQQIPMMQ